MVPAGPGAAQLQDAVAQLAGADRGAQPGRGGVGGGGTRRSSRAVVVAVTVTAPPRRDADRATGEPGGGADQGPDAQVQPGLGAGGLARWSKLPWAPMSSVDRLVEVVRPYDGRCSSVCWPA